MKVMSDLIGLRFGRLTVTGWAGRRQYRRNYINTWICVCDCGRECVRVQRALLDPGESSCGCLNKCNVKRKNYGCGSFNALVGAYKRGAKDRGLEFEISVDEFRELTKSVCHYCGAAPSQKLTNGKCAPYVYNGIDRADNSKGYTKDNVRPCCGNCNLAKRTMNESEFIALAIAISDRHRRPR